MNLRKALLERRHDVGGIIDRQRGLCDIGQVAGIAGLKMGDLVDRLQQRDGADGELSNRTDHLGMPGMSDQHDLASAPVVDLGLAMHLGDKGTGGIDREEVALLGLCGDRLGYSVSGENDRRAGVGNFVELLDEDRALGPQALDHVPVMHNLVAHIDRSAITGERLLDGVDRPHHSGAEPARRAQKHRERGLLLAGRVIRDGHADLGCTGSPKQPT